MSPKDVPCFTLLEFSKHVIPIRVVSSQSDVNRVKVDLHKTMSRPESSFFPKYVSCLGVIIKEGN